MSGNFPESVVEEAALAWLDGLGWKVLNGPEVAPGELAAKRSDYAEVVLAQRLRDALSPKLISGELRVRDVNRFTKRLPDRGRSR